MFPPERIVCLTEETVETLYLLGEERRIVGVSGYAVRPPRVRREKPRVSAFITADVPKILALEPDLVLTFSDLQADIAAELIRRGVAVHAFNQRDVAGIFAMIRTLGALVGAAAKADELARGLEQRLAQARERAARLPRRPRVYFEEWDEPMISGIRWVSELIEARRRHRRVRRRLRPAKERQGPHRDRRAGDRGRARHHHRLLVRQEIRAGEGRGAARLRRDPGGARRLPARDQVGADPAARAGGADRRPRCAGKHRRGMGQRGRRRGSHDAAGCAIRGRITGTCEMTAANMSNPQSTAPLRADLLLVLFLIGFDVAARVLLHTGNVSPVAASALFAGMMLRRRWLALLVPLAAMALSDLFIGGDDWRVSAVVYAALTLPAVIGILARRFGPARAVVPGGAVVLADLLCRDELRGLGVQRHVQPRHGRARAVLRRGAAVPEIHRRRRSVLGRGAVRRRLAGAAADDAGNRARHPVQAS